MQLPGSSLAFVRCVSSLFSIFPQLNSRDPVVVVVVVLLLLVLAAAAVENA